MRVTLAHEVGIDSNKYNDIYDLYLVWDAYNSVQLLIYMKVLFTFVDGGTAASPAKWTEAETTKFVSDWRSAIAGAWTTVRYKTYKDVAISIHVSFETKIGASFPGSHWQILVEKLPEGSTGKTSFVWRDQLDRKYDVQLDSLDHQKKSGVGDGTQTGAIHEFGHMIGLGDEYTSDAAANLQADSKSIMNSGSTIRPRHYDSVVQWAEKKIDKVKDKIDEYNKKSQKPVDFNTRGRACYYA